MSQNKSNNCWALKSSRVCLPAGERPATLVVDGERIAAILVGDENLPGNVPVEDLADLVVCPGLVDAHVHVNEPGRTEWEGFQSATQAAAAGGVTTIIDMPLNSRPVTTSATALAEKRAAAAGKCWVDVGFYGGLVPGSAVQLPALIDAGVLGIKTFLCDSGLDAFPAATEADLRAAMPQLRQRGLPLLVHAELVDAQAPQMSDPRSYQAYVKSRPDAWEEAAIALLINLCDEFRTRVHIVHLASAKALPMIVSARREGLPLSVETCPHYLYFSSKRISEGQTQYKCAPPIRSESNRVLLARALAAGHIDTIGSDHSPCPPERKHLESGNFARAWGGIASLQLTLPVMWTLARQEHWSVDRLVNWLAAAPAELFGLADRKGRLNAGCDADLCVWDPNVEYTVVGTALHHRHSVTPYDGERLHGKVMRTYVRGRSVYMEDKLVGGPHGALHAARP